MTAEISVDSCPACSSRQGADVEEYRGFVIAECGACGLAYTRNPGQTPSYSEVWAGSGQMLDDPRPYRSPATRLGLERDAWFVPPPLLTAAERWVLARLEGSLPPGATVVEAGCGSGRFLRELTRRGFSAVGMETSPQVVDALRGVGLEAFVGFLPEFEWDAPEPAALTMFEVLEHIPEPGPVLARVRDRFPNAAVGASVPSPVRIGLRGGRPAVDYPPNHFLRWTQDALEQAFHRAGYRNIDIALPPPTAEEMGPRLSLLIPIRLMRGVPDRTQADGGGQGTAGVSFRRRLLATTVLAGYQASRYAKATLGALRVRAATRAGYSSAGMAIWAEP